MYYLLLCVRRTLCIIENLFFFGTNKRLTYPPYDQQAIVLITSKQMKIRCFYLYKGICLLVVFGQYKSLKTIHLMVSQLLKESKIKFYF